ncbi:preprotein translocase subunit SecG, partial [Bacillus sp. SIMBA_069]
MHAFLITLLVIVSIALIVTVLLQSGKSAGLSGAIAGGAEQLFGKQKARGL